MLFSVPLPHKVQWAIFRISFSFALAYFTKCFQHFRHNYYMIWVKKAWDDVTWQHVKYDNTTTWYEPFQIQQNCPTCFIIKKKYQMCQINRNMMHKSWTFFHQFCSTSHIHCHPNLVASHRTSQNLHLHISKCIIDRPASSTNTRPIMGIQ